MEVVVDLEASMMVPIFAILKQSRNEVRTVQCRMERRRDTSALVTYVLIGSRSPKKPARTGVRTISIRDPKQRAFLSADFCVSIARFWLR